MCDRRLPFLGLLVALAVLPQAAQAERVHETGNVGLGVGGTLFGLGVSGKWFMNEHNALQGLVGVSNDGGLLFLSPDYLYTFDPLHQEEDVTIDWYGGFGGTLFMGDSFGLGVNAVLGIDFCIDPAPVDIYAELRPMLLLSPVTEFAFTNFAGGVRYYF